MAVVDPFSATFARSEGADNLIAPNALLKVAKSPEETSNASETVVVASL